MKKVKAKKQFYGNYDEKMKRRDEEYVTNDARAKELESKGLVEVLGDTDEEEVKAEQSQDMTKEKTAKPAANRQTKEEKAKPEDK